MPTNKTHGFTIHHNNEKEYHSLRSEIFGMQIYEPKLNPETLGDRELHILDIGAHVGLSTLYFSWILPMAQIVAVEPHPELFRLLEQNIFENNLENSLAIHTAITDSTATEIELFVNNDDKWLSTSSIHEGAWTGGEKTKSIRVPNQRLVNLLDPLSQLADPYVIIKFDVEGAEQKILFESKKKLDRVQELLIEFHPHKTQNLSEIASLLESIGFTLELRKKGKASHDWYSQGLQLLHAYKLSS